MLILFLLNLDLCHKVLIFLHLETHYFILLLL
ncbi:Uncharacterised protein [Edwardsiella ictaluri]|nr:Uncharacterised protein [Edwardsiella ictaluri]